MRGCDDGKLDMPITGIGFTEEGFHCALRHCTGNLFVVPVFNSPQQIVTFRVYNLDYQQLAEFLDLESALAFAERHEPYERCLIQRRCLTKACKRSPLSKATALTRNVPFDAFHADYTKA